MNYVKHLLLLLVVALLALPSKSFAQESNLDFKLSISFKNEKIRDAIKRIEKESGISFAYANLNDLDKRVSGTFEQQTTENILKFLFRNTNL